MWQSQPITTLPFYSFYPTSLEEAFHQCLTSLGQQKYCIAFPLLCSHFMSATNPFCPEEVRACMMAVIDYAPSSLVIQYFLLHCIAPSVGREKSFGCEHVSGCGCKTSEGSRTTILQRTSEIISSAWSPECIAHDGGRRHKEEER